MFIAHIKKGGYDYSNIYYNWKDYFNDTFSPRADANVLDLTITGKTYAERKECARDCAVRWSIGKYPGLSWSELYIIANWFNTIGKQYGLLNEFRGNGVI